MKKSKEKGFARGASREIMKACSESELSLEELIGLEAMQGKPQS